MSQTLVVLHLRAHLAQGLERGDEHPLHSLVEHVDFNLFYTPWHEGWLNS